MPCESATVPAAVSLNLLNWGYDVKVLFATGFQNWEGALTETSQKTCLAYGIYSLRVYGLRINK